MDLAILGGIVEWLNSQVILNFAVNLGIMFKNILTKFGLISAVLVLLIGHAYGVRIKDIADIKGVRQNQLVGYGLVVGLDGTGDDKKSKFTVQSLTSMLERMRVSVSPKDIDVDNVAAVMVTADLPPFARAGSRIDVLVSSIGSAKSLQGGTLLLTPLRAVDGEVYAVAQGPVSLGGGFSAGGAVGRVQKNFPTVGRVIGGGLIEREIDDFMEFWLPIIEGSSWYAVYPQNADELIALHITPAPDNVLRVLLSIRPLEQRIKMGAPPEMKPIERGGFTAVEWGVVGWPEPVAH